VYQGVKLALKKHITQLDIMGDSKNTIRYFFIGSKRKEIKLKSLAERIQLSLSNIAVQYFHILRENKKEAYEMDKRAISLAPGFLGVCG